MIDAQQRAAAKAFAKNWKDRGYEKGDSQIFWVELLTTVFGVTEISQFISFEDQVHLDHASFIDGYIEKTLVKDCTEKYQQEPDGCYPAV